MAVTFKIGKPIDGQLTNEMIKEHFCSELVREHNKIITVKKYDDNKYLEKKTYIYVNADEIYDEILEGKEINLNCAYINSFNIEKKFQIQNRKIKAITAESSFWDKFSFFAFTVFSDTIKFDNAIFNGQLNFVCSKFYGNVIFNDTTFQKDMQFCFAEVNGDSDFSNATFYKDANFSKTQFNGEINFFCADFYNNGLFWRSIFNGYANFFSTRFFGLANFLLSRFNNVLEFSPTELQKLYFDSSYINGKFICFTNFYIIDNALKNFEKIDYGDLSIEYNFFKSNYNKMGRHEEEDMAYCEFRRCNRKFRKKGIRKFIEYLFLDKIGGYGTRPFSVLTTMLITIFAFGLMFYILTLDLNNICFSLSNISKVFDSIYSSAIIFFAMGLGAVEPSSVLLKALTILEGFIGIFLMSYFTVSFARKAMR